MTGGSGRTHRSRRPPTIFISYHEPEVAVAERVVSHLEAEGFKDVVFARDRVTGVNPGTDWEQWIYAQLQRSTCLVFLASPRSLESRWCTAEIAIARSLDRPVLTAVIEPADSYPEFAERFQRVDLRADERTGLRNLVDGLVRLGQFPDESRPYRPELAPYPGLEPFRPDQETIFFGRSAEIADLIRNVGQRTNGLMLAVTGPSGVGKTSLVQAGLVPRLRSGPDAWFDVTWRVASPVVGSLAKRLRLLDADASPDVVTRPSDLADVLERAESSAGADSVLFVVEQAEQLLIETPELERTAIVAALTDARDRGVCVVLTMRSEYLGHPNARELSSRWHRQYPVEHLTRTAMRDAIVEPARRTSVTIEADLVERILDDTDRGDALPLLAFALHELWNHRDGRELTMAAYERIGGVAGALREQADDALALATPTGESNSPVLANLSLLARVEGEHDEPTAARVALNTELQVCYKPFIDRGLVVTRDVDGHPIAEVAHEAVLRQWEPLAQAINEGRATLRLRREVEMLAGNWDGRDPDALLYGERLSKAEQALRGVSDPAVPPFLSASRSADRRRRNRRWYVRGVAVLAVVAVVFGALALRQWQEADRSAELADSAATQSRALQLVAESGRTRPTRLDVASLLAVEALALDDGPAARGAVLDSLEAAPGALVYRGPETLRADTVLLTNRGAVTGSSPSAEIVAIDPTDGRELKATSTPATTIEHLELDPSSGALIGAGVADGRPVLFVVEDAGAVEIAVNLEHPVKHLAAAAGNTAWVDANDAVWAWDGSTASRVARSDADITVFDVSYDGACVALATENGVRVVALSPLCAVADASVTDEAATSLAFSPVDQTLATGSGASLMVWDVGSLGNGRRVATHGPVLRAIRFSPDGVELATGGSDGAVRTWLVDGDSVESRPALFGHEAAVRRIRYGSDGETLASVDDLGTVIAWSHRLDRRLLVSEITPPPELGSVLGVITWGDDGFLVYGTSGAARWSSGSFDRADPTDIVRVVLVNDGPAQHAVSFRDGGIAVLGTEKPALVYPSLPDAVAVAGSPTSDRVVAATIDGTTCVAGAGASEASCSDPAAVEVADCDLGGAVRAVAVEPGDGHVAIGTDRGTVFVRSMAELEVVACVTSTREGAGQINDIDWIIAGGNSTIVVAYDGNDVEAIDFTDESLSTKWILSGHDDSVLALAHRDDGVVASAAEDGRIVLWDVETGQPWGSGMAFEHTTPQKPELLVSSVALGNHAAMSVQEGRLLYWDLVLDNWLRQVCEITDRSLDELEIQRFQIDDPAAATRCGDA